MWIWLDKTGKVYQSLVHGNAPVVGETDFKIFAYFDGLDPETINAATIKFRRPDMQGSTYPVLFMRQKDLNYVPMASDGNNCLFKVSNNPYRGFIFDFSSFLSGDEIIRILDTPGMWEATITLLRYPNNVNVTGLIKFYVGNSTLDDDLSELSEDQILENVVLSLNSLSQLSTSYIKVSSNFVEDAADGALDSNIFSVSSIVFDKATKSLYRILTVTENPQDEAKVYATYVKELDFSGKQFVTVEDGRDGLYVVDFSNNTSVKIEPSSQILSIKFVIPGVIPQGWSSECVFQTGQRSALEQPISYILENNSRYDVMFVLNGEKVGINDLSSIAQNSTVEVIAKFNGFNIRIYLKSIRD